MVILWRGEKANQKMTNIEVRRREAYIAFTRFGLGAKHGSFDAIVDDPRGAVLNEMETPNVALLRMASLPNYEQACAATGNQVLSNRILTAEINARARKCLWPEIGFVERLVIFWSNHFNISVNAGGPALSTAGDFERNRIRPHVLGNFKDMLLAVMSHPAMLHYLQNGLSVGPNSAFGRRSGRGINENLGRELLELHTVGVAGGYTQTDVDSASKLLTGFSYVTPWHAANGWEGGTPQNKGRFIFRGSWQEPGSQTVLRRSFSGSGMSKCQAMLESLAIHDSTAQHIAFKLVKHFITDTPVPNMVRPVAAAFRRSRGDLKETYRALLNLRQAWMLPLTKIRTPYELLMSQRRALGAGWSEVDFPPLGQALRFLSNQPWQCDSPDGYPDSSEHWLSPGFFMIRVTATQMILRRLLNRRRVQSSALEIAEGVLGNNLGRNTATELSGLRDSFQGLCTLFMSPEFQKR